MQYSRPYKINQQQAIDLKDYAARSNMKIISLLHLPWVKFETLAKRRTMLHINTIKANVAKYQKGVIIHDIVH